ncbi:MAG: hypothetical protein JJV97_04180 [SAR324 cluster bacterium]|nr:hypothetical protein [SAR324 cluster bacterium]
MLIFKIVIKFLISLPVIMLITSNLYAQYKELKFYNVEFLVKETPPINIYAVTKQVNGDFTRKLKLSFLEKAIGLEIIEPERLILDNQQFIFLIATYPNHVTLDTNPCYNKNNRYFLILKYKYNSLQLVNSEALDNCVKGIKLAHNQTSDNNSSDNNNNNNNAGNTTNPTDGTADTGNANKKTVDNSDSNNNNNNNVSIKWIPDNMSFELNFAEHSHLLEDDRPVVYTTGNSDSTAATIDTNNRNKDEKSTMLKAKFGYNTSLKRFLLIVDN